MNRSTPLLDHRWQYQKKHMAIYWSSSPARIRSKTDRAAGRRLDMEEAGGATGEDWGWVGRGRRIGRRRSRWRGRRRRRWIEAGEEDWQCRTPCVSLWVQAMRFCFRPRSGHAYSTAHGPIQCASRFCRPGPIDHAKRYFPEATYSCSAGWIKKV